MATSQTAEQFAKTLSSLGIKNAKTGGAITSNDISSATKTANKISSSTKAQDAAYNNLMSQIQGGVTANSGKQLDTNAILNAYTGAGGSQSNVNTFKQLEANQIAKYAGMPTNMVAPVPSPFTPGVTTSGMAGLGVYTQPTETEEPKKETSATDLFQQYMTAQQENQMPSLANEYAKAEKQAEIAQKQQAVNDYTAQLNTIVARQQSDLLQLRGTAAQEGVTEAVYGGQAATINREAAIAALPVQAQLAAAQGNLEMAQERLDTLFKLKMEDAKNKYEFTNNVIDKYYNFASEQQKIALAEKKEEKQRAYDIEDRNFSTAQSWAKLAIDNGQAGVASSIAKLDTASPTFQSDLAKLTGQISMGGTDTAELIRLEQLKKLRRENGATSFDGFLDDAEIKKIDTSPQGKAVKALGDLKTKIQTYKNLVEEYGTETPLGGQKPQLDSAYADLKLAYKEAANLGALTGPDVQLLEEAIKPATYGGFFAPIKRFGAVVTRQGAGSVLGGLNQALETINKAGTKNINELYTRNPRYPSSWYVQEIIKPFDDVTMMSDDDIVNSLDGLSPEQLQSLKDEGLI